MRNITKIVMCLIFVLMCVSLVQSQKTKIVKGYLCGSREGMHAGTMGIRVGTKVILIGHTFSVAPGEYSEMSEQQARKYIRENTTKYFKASPNFDKIGSEYVVKYKNREVYNWAFSITFTGRTKKTSRCPVE